MTLEVSAVCEDADQSAWIYVCFACGLKISKQDAFSSRAIQKFGKKKYKIDGGLNAYILFDICESKSTTKHRKMYVFLETGVIKRHIYHLMSGFGTSKSVLQKQSVLLRAEVISHLCTKMRKKTQI